MGIESLQTAAAAAGFAMAASEDLLVAEPAEKSSKQVEQANPWGARDMSEPKGSTNLPALRPATSPVPSWSQMLVRGVYSLMGRGATA